MKKQLTVLGISVLLISSVIITAFTPQEKDKNKQEQKQEKGKGQEKSNKEGKGNAGKNNNDQAQGKKDEKAKPGRDQANERGRNNDNKNNGRNDDNSPSSKNNRAKGFDYKWDRETFKDRDKIKGGEKVTLCHKFNSGDEPAVTIRVSVHAQKAHMAHGDVIGECAEIRDDRFSDNFLRRRTDYFNNLQESQEQVLYSRSILDYALERLTNSRLQLTRLQNSNAPRTDIERKQATVLELEQNVGLLETLLGVTANLIANKLQ